MSCSWSCCSLHRHSLEIYIHSSLPAGWFQYNNWKLWCHQASLVDWFLSPLFALFSFLKKFILFIYFWLRWVFVAERGLSLFAAGELGFSLLRCGGFSCCGARALGVWASVVVARGLSCSTARGIFPDQGSNCFGRWILNHCATREVPLPYFLRFFLYFSPKPTVLPQLHKCAYL